MKKWKNIFIIVLCVTQVMGVPVYAYDHDTGWVEWENCDWTPDFSRNIDCQAAEDFARCRTDFSFDQATYDVVCDAYTNDTYYFTVEHSTLTSNPMTASEDLFSFLPNPHYDYDDNFFWDGLYDEVEVVCLSPEDIRVDYNYYFSSWWDITEPMVGGAFDVITQLSDYTRVTGEYDEEVSDYITSPGFTCVYSSLNLNNITANVHSNTGTSSVIAPIRSTSNEVKKFFTQINDFSSLEAYKNDIKNQYTAIKCSNNDTSKTSMVSFVDEQIDKVDAVITFTEPVSLEYLESLLNDTCSLVNYEAKMVNSENDWMTMLSKRMNQDELMYVATTMSGEDDLVFCGVTSATVNIPVNDNTYDILCAEDKIYLVDMSEYIIKMQLNDFTVDVDVSDCYYYLEKWN